MRITDARVKKLMTDVMSQPEAKSIGSDSGPRVLIPRRNVVRIPAIEVAMAELKDLDTAERGNLLVRSAIYQAVEVGAVPHCGTLTYGQERNYEGSDDASELIAVIREGCRISPIRWNRLVLGAAELFIGDKAAGKAVLSSFLKDSRRTWRSYARLWIACLDLEMGIFEDALANSQSAFETLWTPSAAFNLAVTSLLSGRADLFLLADEALEGASMNATSRAVIAAAMTKLDPHRKGVRTKLGQRPEPMSAVGRGIINAVWN